MKLLFVHDGPVFGNDLNEYYEYSYHGLYDRYSYIADDITFLMRVQPLSNDTKGTKIPSEVHVIPVPEFKSLKTIKNLRIVASIIESAVKQSDCVVLRGSSCSTIALKYVKEYHIPYIFECVGCSWDSMWNHSLVGKFLAPFAFLSSRKIIKHAPFVYYVTDKFLQRRYPTNAVTVGCSNVVIRQVDDCVLERRIIKIRNGSRRCVLGTAAALDVKYKGQDDVIKVLPRLLQEGWDIYYKLAGSNRSNSTYLVDLVKKLGLEDRVVFCGSLNENEMESFYDSLDLYIQPSKQEGLPRSIIEAMSRGVPVLGSNIAGIPELIDNECLFKKNNSKSIKDVIIKVLNSNLEDLAVQNFKKARYYDISVLNDKRKKFYDTFIKESNIGSV